MTQLEKTRRMRSLFSKKRVTAEKYKEDTVIKLILEEDKRLQHAKAISVIKKSVICSVLASLVIGVLFTAGIIPFSVKNLLLVLVFIVCFLLATGAFLLIKKINCRSWSTSKLIYKVTASENDNIPAGAIIFPHSRSRVVLVIPSIIKMLEETVEKAKIISYFGSLEELEHFTSMFPDELYLSDDIYERGIGLRFLTSYLKIIDMAEEEDADIKECFKEHFNSASGNLKARLTEKHISLEIGNLVDTEYFDTLIAGSYCLGSDSFSELLEEVSGSDE